MATPAGGGAALCGPLLDYKTEKFALTRNRRVGLLHRLLQLAVLGYVLGWVFVVRRGYQDTDAAPRVSVVTKLKGVSVSRPEDARRRLWDAADFSRPPQGENVLFLVTNFIVTDRQVQGTCPESPSVLDGICMEDVDCSVGNPVVHGNGIKTGRCVMFNSTHSTCEIFGWCPVENDTLPRKPLLAEAENFTLFIKNTVNFTKFNFSKGNTLQTNDPTYFKTCMYDPFFSPSCPVFRIRDMVEAAGETFGALALMGGSISVRIEWDCDLDWPAAHCQPRYSFILLDRRYNFRPPSSVTWFCSTWMRRLTSIGRRSLRRQNLPKVRKQQQLRHRGLARTWGMLSNAHWSDLQECQHQQKSLVHREYMESPPDTTCSSRAMLQSCCQGWGSLGCGRLTLSTRSLKHFALLPFPLGPVKSRDVLK
ncbi:P2X purinoceptor 6 isoform X1 [Gallus gallus]|uniref:P2X purinoceptor 6 isoform X1 n=1 Tax=Gallus gallus TaxID=9031 RepID=UPI001AE13C4A|nr:P2X purinoceptor 6 isoform X1 [Gallus gallus]